MPHHNDEVWWRLVGNVQWEAPINSEPAEIDTQTDVVHAHDA